MESEIKWLNIKQQSVNNIGKAGHGMKDVRYSIILKFKSVLILAQIYFLMKTFLYSLSWIIQYINFEIVNNPSIYLNRVIPGIKLKLLKFSFQSICEEQPKLCSIYRYKCFSWGWLVWQGYDTVGWESILLRILNYLI